MSYFKPMLSPQESPVTKPDFFETLPYPVLVSAKIDGIRGIPQDGVVLSRTCKPLRSLQLQEQFSMDELEFLDAEFVEGDPCTPDCYNRAQSYIMSHGKPGDLKMYVFDDASPHLHGKAFWHRLELAKARVLALNRPDVVFVEHHLCENKEEILTWEDHYLSLGYEGLMIRNQMGGYKHHARATWLDQIIFKLKRVEEDEGLIVGIEEGTLNENEQFFDERGYAKRSKAKAGLVPSGTLGRFLVLFEGEVINVGPGVFTHPERLHIYTHPEDYINKVELKFKHMKVGAKDAPRQAVATGFRDPTDK